MGFLDRLRGGGDVIVSVSADPVEPSPGGQVVVRFDVGGALDDKCRGVRVGLRAEGRYLVTERDRDSDGGSQTREVWRELELHEEEHHYPAQLGPGQATFTLPEDAAPSSPDAVEWTASARIDRERGMDKVERLPLAVRQSADRMPQERAPRTSDDGLTLDHVPIAARAGETVGGYLSINLADDTKVTAVRIRLHRKCTYVAETINGRDVIGGTVLDSFVFSARQSRITRDEKVAEADLSGKREFARGVPEQIPFGIAVPAGAGPTTGHAHATVEWRLEAVLDRRMRGDLSVDTPLIVY